MGKDLARKQGEMGLTDREAIYMFGSVFDAAATSTSSAMMSFVLAMVRQPEWFAKLQDEVDRVVGPERLPDFDDSQTHPWSALASRRRCALPSHARWLSAQVD